MALAARRVSTTEIQRNSAFKSDDPALFREQPVTLLEFLHRSQPLGLCQSIPRNQTVIEEGDSADQVFELVSGALRVCKYTPGGRRHILDFVLAGEMFGLVEQSEHTLCTEAVTDTVFRSYSRSRLDRLAAGDPTIRRRIVGAISDQLVIAQRQLVILGCQDARERMASFFLRLADRAGLKPGNCLALHMGRQDIADHLGLTIETVCRTVRALHRAGTVTMHNVHELTISDLAALRALASEK